MAARKKHIAEAGDHSQRVEYRGKRYQMTVKDKMNQDDGVMESHLSYDPLDRPKGAKSRGNFTTGLSKCLGKCKCFDKKCEKKKS